MLKSTTTAKVYTSPTKKLARFFEKSRDGWKAKCRTAKVRLKRHKQRVRRLEQSRDQWKQRASDLEAEVARLKASDPALEQTMAVVKNEEPTASVPWEPEGWELRAYRHTYSIGCVALFLALVLEAATSLRGAARVLELMGTALDLPIPTPTWSAGRLWILRVGYYKLTRPKAIADDWVITRFKSGPKNFW